MPRRCCFVYGEYRTVFNGVYTTSYPGSSTITLNTTDPVVNLNSPAGILNPDSSPALELAQPQLLNSDYAQWITYSGWSTAVPTETVSFTTLDACPSTGSCTQIASGLGVHAVPVGVGDPGQQFHRHLDSGDGRRRGR